MNQSLSQTKALARKLYLAGRVIAPVLHCDISARASKDAGIKDVVTCGQRLAELVEEINADTNTYLPSRPW